MSGQIPIINGSGLSAERILLHRSAAQSTVRRWIDFMRVNRLSICLFHSHGVPANDEGGLSIGMRAEELALEGYTVTSHSSAIIQEQNGVLITMVSSLVKAPPKALLG